VTFDATGSRGAGRRGRLQLGSSTTPVPPPRTVERQGTTPTITHTFPRGRCVLPTGLAVFNPDGLSAGTGGIVTTGQNGFTPGVHGLAGRRGTGVPETGAGTVTFSALTTVSGQPVINYLWGVRGRVNRLGLPRPRTHYDRPGTYTVTARSCSGGVGSAFPGAGRRADLRKKKITVGARHGGGSRPSAEEPVRNSPVGIWEAAALCGRLRPYRLSPVLRGPVRLRVTVRRGSVRRAERAPGQG